MYCIMNVIYGVPMTRGALKQLVANGEFEDEPRGYLEYYSGSGDTAPAAFGVKLDCFDEATDYTEVSKLKLTPTEAQITKFNKLVAALDPKRRQAIKSAGEPTVFILYSTS